MLTTSQCESMLVHARRALYSVMESFNKEVEQHVPLQHHMKKEDETEEPKEVTSLETLDDFLDIFSQAPQLEVADDPDCVAMDRVQKEMDDFKSLDVRDFSIGHGSCS